MGRLLVYGTGGLAFGGIEMSQDFTFLSETHSETNTAVGWTAGAGVDHAVTGFPALRPSSGR
jgi:outer membrane immunogenic protein